MSKSSESGCFRVGNEVMVASNKLRGRWNTEVGQQVEQWIPGGLYLIEPHDNPVLLTLRDDRGRTFDVAASIIG